MASKTPGAELLTRARTRVRALLAGKRRRETILTATLVVVAVLSVIGATWATVRARTTAQQPSAPSIFQAGGYALGGIPAPNFTLTDQHGATVSLAQFHGRPVVLTFFDSVCPHPDCSLMAQYVNVTAHDMGVRDATRVAWVALTVNPWHDTPASATAFLQSRQVTIPIHYLLGTPDQMAPIWNEYHMQATLQSDGIVIHTTGVYVIDATGREQAYLEEGFDPRALSVYLEQVLKQAGSSAKSSVGGSSSSQPSGTVIQSQTVNGYTVELTATPAQYGTYNFTVTVEDQQGAPVQGAGVSLTLTMSAMEMVPVTVALAPSNPPIPGTYQAQGVISMIGQWKAKTTITLPGGSQPLQTTFTFNARY